MMLLCTNEILRPAICGCFYKLEVEVLFCGLLFDAAQNNNERINVFKETPPKVYWLLGNSPGDTQATSNSHLTAQPCIWRAQCTQAI